jgi:hypothetical protein
LDGDGLPVGSRQKGAALEEEFERHVFTVAVPPLPAASGRTGDREG